jgi:DnaJ-class molecular chaperone
MSSLKRPEGTRNCPKCHGSGEIPRLDLSKGRYNTPCDRCNGEGYLSAQDDDD